jgi:C4-dicarboxylate-specific signal transduction histidine kinase
MNALDLKRMKLEMIKVAAARAELEFRVEERLDEINRIKDHIKVQLDKEAELQAKITDAEKTV